MENEPNALQRSISRITEKIAEQQWFQELKTKWEELDPQSRFYLSSATAVILSLLIVIVLVTSIWKVHSLKKELSTKSDLITMLDSASDEIRNLRAEGISMTKTQESGPAGAAEQSWKPYFENAATAVGIDRTAASVSDAKPGATTNTAKEVLLDITLRHVNIKQVIRYAHQVENGGRPAKLRNLSIDTKNDPSGYMDAILSVSAFSIK